MTQWDPKKLWGEAGPPESRLILPDGRIKYAPPGHPDRVEFLRVLRLAQQCPGRLNKAADRCLAKWYRDIPGRLREWREA